MDVLLAVPRVAFLMQILLTQQQLMKAKSDEENKGGGAADARRWNGLRNVVESRALLKTAFRTASTLKAQVCCMPDMPCMLTSMEVHLCKITCGQHSRLAHQQQNLH